MSTKEERRVLVDAIIVDLAIDFVTLPTDEDVSFHFHASTMKEWLKPRPSEEAKP